MRFEAELAPVLPALEHPFELAHVRTTPKKCRRLVYASKRASKGTPLDQCSTHLFVLGYDNLHVFALETIMYESIDSMTLFVSKADTTGHFYEDAGLSIIGVTTALIRGLLRYYAKPAKPIRICLFAKAERQYLFPLSSENPKKHVLSDSALVKWWLRALNPLKSEFSSISRATLQIPGANKKDIEQFFPRDHELPWSVGDVFGSGQSSEDRPKGAVYYVPRFPDDPKCRFLDYLVAEKRARQTPMDRFWLELQSRQEFRLGSVVGIIGLEGIVNHNSQYQQLLEDEPHTIPEKQYTSIKEGLLSWSYATKETAKISSSDFSELLPAFCILELQGTNRVAKRKQSEAAALPAANVLGGMLVRKKAKTK